MKIILSIFLFLTFNLAISQAKVFSFKEAKQQGIEIEKLDLEYHSAVHVDSTKAVFKTEVEQLKLQNAYVKLLKDFGSFLNENNFKWKSKTKCFQRIYFSPNGKIDYFIYNFNFKNTAAELVQDDEKLLEFDRLLKLFIANYTFEVTANQKFAQCSPTTYQ